MTSPTAVNDAVGEVLLIVRPKVATVVWSVAESLASPVLGSVTEAVLAITVPAEVPTFTVWEKTSTCCSPFFRLPGHVTVLAASAHEPAGPVDEVRVAAPTPELGNVSVTTSGLAVVSAGPSMSAGPLFVTVIVQVIGSPRTTCGFGLATLVIARS